MKKKTLIFDLNNLFFSCFCANPSVNSNNHHIGGIVGTLQMIQKICMDVKPHQLFMVWDGAKSSKRRKALNENYKEGRSAPRPYTLNKHFQYENEEKEAENRRYQQARVVEILSYCPVVQLIEPGIEADDVISYLVQNVNKDGINIAVSNDKDYLQLVEKDVVLYRFTTKVYLTKEDVVEKYGILPSNMALARAVEGDQSDNLKGVDRVGMKTIIKYFPELKKKENILFDEFFQLVEEKNKIKTTVALPNILSSRQLIEDNYKIMQLYSPMIDAITTISLEESIKSKTLGFSLTAFNLQLMKDGMQYSDFINLVDHFNRIVNFSKLNNKIPQQW